MSLSCAINFTIYSECFNAFHKGDGRKHDN